ncbi:hypothetical protein EON65_36355 [archaeon]|nr:MAG: hypothetical protein EON65_36355 [archaeon]
MPRYEIKTVQFIKQQILKKKDHPLYGIIVDAHVICMTRRPMLPGVIYIKSIMNSTLCDAIVESFDKVSGFERNIHGFVTPIGPSLVSRIEIDIANSNPVSTTKPASSSVAADSSSAVALPIPSATPKVSLGLKPKDKASLIPPASRTANDWAGSVTTNGENKTKKLPVGGNIQETLSALREIMGNMSRLRKLRRKGIPDNDLLEAAFTNDNEEEENSNTRGRVGDRNGGAYMREMLGGGRGGDRQRRWGEERWESSEASMRQERENIPWKGTVREDQPQINWGRGGEGDGVQSGWPSTNAEWVGTDIRKVNGMVEEPIADEETLGRASQTRRNGPAGPKTWGKREDRGKVVKGRWGEGDSRHGKATRMPEIRTAPSSGDRRTQWKREMIDDGYGFTLDQVLDEGSGSSSRRRDNLGDLYDIMQEEAQDVEQRKDIELTTRGRAQQGQGVRQEVKGERTSKDRSPRVPSKSGVEDFAKDVSSFASFDDFLAAISGESSKKK